MRRLIVTLLIASMIALIGCSTFNDPGMPVNVDEGKVTQEVAKVTQEVATVSTGGNKLEGFLEDLNDLKEAISQVHPSTINGLSPEIVDLFHQTQKELSDTTTLEEFRTLVSRILSSLDDAHSKVRDYDSFGTTRLPLAIERVDHAWYITSSDNLDLIGCKILEIGHVNIEAIFEHFKSIRATENHYFLNALFKRDGLNSEVLSGAGVVFEGNSVKLLVEKGPETYNETIILSGKRHYTKAKTSETLDGIQLYFKSYKAIHSSKLNTLYIDYTVCDHLEVFDEIFTYAIDNQIDNLIIDLRANGGGTTINYAIVKHLPISEFKSVSVFTRYSDLAQSQRDHEINEGLWSKPSSTNDQRMERTYDGRLFVLVGNYTFSAASDFAMFVKINNLGTIVGAPTGGAVKCYGDVIYCELKNTGIKYQLSYREWFYDIESPENTLLPDYEVRYTIKDYIEAKDLEMEKVIELIMK